MTVGEGSARTGLLMLMLGSAIDSSAGLLTRLIGSDGFTITSARGLIAFVAVLTLLLWRDGLKFYTSLLAVGLWGLAIVAVNSTGMLMNILSLNYTGVANFYMIFATAPFAAALAARVVTGEKLDTPTLLAALVGFVGIAIMMFTGTKGGALIGDLLAVACVITFSGLILIVRNVGKLDILAISCLTVLSSGLIALPFADFGSFDQRDWGLMLIFGVVQLATANLLLFYAMQNIPPAQSGLLGILNAAFAPLWVFFFLGEVPSTNVLIGGGVILAASGLHLLWTIFHTPKVQVTA